LKRPTNPAFAANLERWLRWIPQDFQNNILPVTKEIAEVWGTLSPNPPLAEPDGLIAATAMHYNLILVTRNVRDVQRSGGTILNPWDA